MRILLTNINLRILRAHIDTTLQLIDNVMGLGIIRGFWKATISRHNILICFLAGLQGLAVKNKYLRIAIPHSLCLSSIKIPTGKLLLERALEY